MERGAPKASLVVRPVRQEERAAWRELMQQHHYLGFEHPSGSRFATSPLWGSSGWRSWVGDWRP